MTERTMNQLMIRRNTSRDALQKDDDEKVLFLEYSRSYTLRVSRVKQHKHGYEKTEWCRKRKKRKTQKRGLNGRGDVDPSTGRVKRRQSFHLPR